MKEWMGDGKLIVTSIVVVVFRCRQFGVSPPCVIVVRPSDNISSFSALPSEASTSAETLVESVRRARLPRLVSFSVCCQLRSVIWKVKVPSLMTLYTNEECQRQGSWVRTTCPESLLSRNRAHDLLIASPMPYCCATTPPLSTRC